MLSTHERVYETDSALCERCRGRLVCDPDTDERVCCSCGMVYENAGAYFGVSWGSRSLGLIARPDSAESASSMTYDIDLPTVIGNKNFDAAETESAIDMNYSDFGN